MHHTYMRLIFTTSYIPYRLCVCVSVFVCVGHTGEPYKTTVTTEPIETPFEETIDSCESTYWME